MKKINIIGTSGSGKSTFGKRLADQLGYVLIELDTLHWQDNWQFLSDEDFFDNIEIQLARPTWVLDGNYTRTTPIKWRDVDTVIWLNYCFPLVLFRAIKRAVIRVATQETLWNTNNTESLTKLFSKDSIIWWTIKTHAKNRRKYRAIMNSSDYEHIHFVELTSPRKARDFLAEIKNPCTQ